MRSLWVALVVSLVSGCGAPTPAVEPSPTRAGTAISVAADAPLALREGAGVSLEGLSLDSVAGPVSLGVARIGRGDDLERVRGERVARVGERIERSLGAGLREWWRMHGGDVEHGLDVRARSKGEGALSIELDTGALVAHERSAGVLALVGPEGGARATYAGLFVVDATGARIPSELSVDDGRIRIVVDDARAVYPIVIDPVVSTQTAELNVTFTTRPNAGDAVAMSPDGTVVVASLPRHFDSTESGAWARWSLSGGTWTRTLQDAPSSSRALLGDGDRSSVATCGGRSYIGMPEYPDLNAMGARIEEVGAVFNMGDGSAIRPSSTGSQNFGNSVALSDDCVWLYIGVPRDGNGTLRAIQGATTYVVPTPTGAREFGMAMATDATGTRVVVSDRDQIWIMRRTGTTWALEAPVDVPGFAPTRDGFPLAMNSDGTRVVAGAPREAVGGVLRVGAVYVYQRTGTSWAEEGQLRASDGALNDELGGAVAISDDGVILASAGLDDTAAGTDAGSVRAFVFASGTWHESGTLLAPDAVAGDRYGTGLSIARGGRSAAVGVPFDDPVVTSTGSVRVVSLTRGPGTRCDMGSQCDSGFCADGVCCSTACGGGNTGDCQACTMALTGLADGTCGTFTAGTTCRPSGGVCDLAEVCDGTAVACPANVLVARGTTCNDTTGPCDVAEVCDGATPACPGDALLPAGLVCRPAGGACDVEETCTASSPACPADALAAAGLVCRPPAPGGCDVAEICTGLLAACPGDLFAPSTTTCGPAVSGVCDAPDRCTGTSGDCMPTFLSGTECRPAAGACDLPESCSGADAACPSDVLVSSGVACGGSGTGSCSSPGTCNGASATCPGATPFPVNTVCMPATPGNPCDLDDVCDGTTDVCRAVFAPSTTACGPAVSGDCDAPDHCAGTSADCEAEFLIGTECREGRDTCDAPEICGSAPECPPDLVALAGLSCRASTDTSCDPAEMCDGTSIVCPADVTTCMARPDVGPMADVPTPDAGPPPPPATTGCACGVGARHSFELPMAISMLLLGLLRRRRLRRESTAA